MPGATSVYGLPYLQLSDAPDIAGATQDLAEAVETELSRIDAHPQPAQATDLTTLSSITVTGPTAGSPVVGLTFTAPASGMVYVTVTGSLTNSQNGNSTLLSYEVRAGGTIGSGTVLTAASFNRAVQTSDAVNTGGAARVTASNRFLVSGLTSGSTYNARTMHWVSPAGTGTVLYRGLLVEPVL